MKEWKLASSDGVNELRVVTWEPEGEVKAILQISHGMIEHMLRYAEFAEFLNAHGILVVGNDHLGHGYSAKTDEDLGYFAKEGKSKVVVEDLHLVTEAVKKEYPNVPYFLLGHSMGSFMARRYIMNYGEELDGAIIMGTGTQPGFVLAFAKGLCKVIKAIRGERHRSQLIKLAAFGAYNSHIKPTKTASDWLSRDEEKVQMYRKDKFCRFDFTVNGYETLFDAIGYIQESQNIAKIPKNLPILIVSGEEDPVGAYGKGPRQVYASYKKLGIKDLELKMYPEDRHEVLNELDRQTVFADMLTFLEKHI